MAIIKPQVKLTDNDFWYHDPNTTCLLCNKPLLDKHGNIIISGGFHKGSYCDIFICSDCILNNNLNIIGYLIADSIMATCNNNLNLNRLKFMIGSVIKRLNDAIKKAITKHVEREIRTETIGTQ